MLRALYSSTAYKLPKGNEISSRSSKVSPSAPRTFSKRVLGQRHSTDEEHPVIVLQP